MGQSLGGGNNYDGGSYSGNGGGVCVRGDVHGDSHAKEGEWVGLMVT